MSGSTAVPLAFTSAGPATTPPATLNATLIANATALVPSLTTDLPGSLIEDFSSTGTGALIAIDQARVDAVNNVTPLGANPFVLAALGQQAGIPQGAPTNTSVYVVFSGSPGFLISPGFVVSDGTYQYTIQNGGTIGAGGSSQQLYAVATSSGTWPVPANTVTQLATSTGSVTGITVTNPSAGNLSLGAESVPSYRSRVLLAGQAATSGLPATLKTALLAVPGVSPQLVSIVQATGGYKVICGGGDSYQIAGAIYQSVPDITTLQVSATTARNVSVSIYDAPNTYSVPFVIPPQQVVTVAATWNTTLTGFTSGAQVNQLAAPALQSYINSIFAGQPINELEMQAVFQTAVASVLSSVNLTTLQFVVTINGTTASPSAGTSIISGDPESYFYCSATGATSVQG